MAIVVVGCAGPRVGQQPPETVLPPRYAAELQPGDGQGVTGLCWRSLLGTDASATRAVEQALGHNRDLAIASAQLQQAETQLRLRRLENQPSIAATLGASVNRTTTGATAAGALLEKLYPELSKDIGLPETATYPLYEAQLSVSDFEIDLWRRLHSLTVAARARALAASWNREAVQLALLRDVVDTYVRHAEIEDRLRLTRQVRALSVEQLLILEKREGVGLDDGRLALEQRDRIQDIDGTIADLSLQSATLANALQALTGVSDAGETGDMLAQSPGPDRIDAGLPSQLLLNRPDIRAAEYRLGAAQADIKATRARLFPSIQLTGLMGFASTELQTLVAGNAMVWTGGSVVDLPIFDRSKRRADLRLAEARESETMASYQKTVESAFREVNNALAARRWYKVQSDALGRRIDLLSARDGLARTREAAGLDDGRTALMAEQGLLADRIQQSALRARQIEASIAVYISLGGGSAGCAAPKRTAG